MKKRWMVLIAMFLFLFNSGNVSATLMETSTGSGVLYDDVNDQYWYQDLRQFRFQTYSEQLISINDLNNSSSGFISSDWGNWHLADSFEMTNLWSDNAPLDLRAFSPSYPTSSRDEWFGRYERVYDGIGDPSHYMGYLRIQSDLTITENSINIHTPDDVSIYYVSAWVTADGINPVPEPTTMLLFGLGLLSVAGVSRRKK